MKTKKPNFLDVLLRPETWSRCYPIDKFWDVTLNALLDAQEPTAIGDFTCTIGNVRVWIENIYYGFGRLIDDSSGRPHNFVPTRRTQIRLFRAISNDLNEKTPRGKLHSELKKQILK